MRCIPSPKVGQVGYDRGLQFICVCHGVSYPILNADGTKVYEITIDHFLELIREHQGVTPRKE